jgi:hypothetical protein
MLEPTAGQGPGDLEAPGSTPSRPPVNQRSDPSVLVTGTTR